MNNSFQVYYATSVDGKSPDMLSPPSYIPTSELVDSELSDEDLVDCGCSARRSYQLTLSAAADVVKEKAEEIKEAVLGAWKESNPGRCSQ